MFTEVNFSNLKSKALADYVTSLFIVTSSKLANWRQCSWNNILFVPVDTPIDILKKDVSKPSWDNVFHLIAEDIFKLTNNWRS